MKFLHTSDLHIGKKLDGISRLDEQVEVLNQIIQIAQDENVDVVLISGDVFDTFIPSAEAEGVFFDFAVKLSSGKRIVLTISGNHDDDQRLNAAVSLASKYGIYLCGKENNFANAKYGQISLDCSRDNYVILSNEEQRVFVATLPYFGEFPIGQAFDENEDYSDRYGRVLNDIFSKNTDNLPSILMAHLFMLGGQTTEGERAIDLGGARIVSPSVIPSSCLYTALGHLHKKQVVSGDRNIIYCGSPMQYSYDEAGNEKQVVIFEIKDNRVENLKNLSLTAGKNLQTITISNIESASDVLSRVENCFVSLTINTDNPLSQEQTRQIKENFPFVTQIRINISGDGSSDKIEGRKFLKDDQLFVEYIKSKYGKEPDEELLKIYLEIMEAVYNETDKT